jgi:hypothetical protein
LNLVRELHLSLKEISEMPPRKRLFFITVIDLERAKIEKHRKKEARKRKNRRNRRRR